MLGERELTLQARGEAVLEKLPGLVANVEKVIYGKREAVTLAVVGLLAEGHILLEDVPGTGKTTLARALARSVDLAFNRIQFTSDLLPADVLGVAVPDPRTAEFVFQPGPIFGNVVLADELNRTTPRTQSALLECMNEQRVSVEGQTRQLPRPFLVVATQNPLEFEGTYPLPESQLDRFLMRLRLGYPDKDAERQVLRSQVARHPIEDLKPVMARDEIKTAIAAVRQVRVDDAIVDYILELLAATRRGSRFLLGLSSRAGLGLFRASQALAALEGRAYCVPDDVKRLARPVLVHRLIPRPTPGSDGDDGERALGDVLDSVPVPE